MEGSVTGESTGALLLNPEAQDGTAAPASAKVEETVASGAADVSPGDATVVVEVLPPHAKEEEDKKEEGTAGGTADAPPTATSGSNKDEEDEWRTVQEQRPFCAAGTNCSILDAEHYVVYRHTALNKKERQAMDERREAEERASKAAEVKKEDKKAVPRLMDFLGGRKKESERKLKDDKKEVAVKDEPIKAADPPSTTSTGSSTSPTKPKDTPLGGFTLKKIFGRKADDEDKSDIPADDVNTASTALAPAAQSASSPPKISPILSQSPYATESDGSKISATGEGGTSGNDGSKTAEVTQGSSWMAARRASLSGRIEEIKKSMQDSSQAAQGEEQDISDRLATFKKAAEELDILEKELELVLAMGDSFYVWQSQKRRIVEVTSRGEIVACELLYQSPFLNDWSPISQQISLKSSLLSSGPSYAYCRVRLLTKDGKQINSFDELPRDAQPTLEVKLATTLRYVDEVKSFGIDERATTRKIDSAARGMNFKIEWKNGSREQWFAEDGDGLAKVIYYHLRAYNLRRAKQVGRLRGLWCLACTTYDSSDKQHESELMALWQAVFPDLQLSGRVSPQWKQLGFQGNDPATDFRGMGLLGLTTLLYFARHHPDTLAELLKQGRLYPWASAGINLTQMLFKSLKLDDPLIRSADSSEGWDTPLFIFMTMKDNEDERNLFEEVFCQLFLLFDRVWMISNAGYMDFPNVLNKVMQMFEEILQQRPNNVTNLHQRLMLACEQLQGATGS